MALANGNVRGLRKVPAGRSRCPEVLEPCPAGFHIVVGDLLRRADPKTLHRCGNKTKFNRSAKPHGLPIEQEPSGCLQIERKARASECFRGTIAAPICAEGAAK